MHERKSQQPLAHIASSRIAVLVGPAGTGKTTVLQLMLQQKEIVGTRVQLLAPTGKARVRLGQETGWGNDVQNSSSIPTTTKEI